MSRVIFSFLLTLFLVPSIGHAFWLFSSSEDPNKGAALQAQKEEVFNTLKQEHEKFCQEKINGFEEEQRKSFEEYCAKKMAKGKNIEFYEARFIEYIRAPYQNFKEFLSGVNPLKGALLSVTYEPFKGSKTLAFILYLQGKEKEAFDVYLANSYKVNEQKIMNSYQELIINTQKFIPSYGKSSFDIKSQYNQWVLTQRDYYNRLINSKEKIFFDTREKELERLKPGSKPIGSTIRTIFEGKESFSESSNEEFARIFSNYIKSGTLTDEKKVLNYLDENLKILT